MSLNNGIIIRLFILLFFTACVKISYGQQETYFYKIQGITSKEHSASRVYDRLDSLEKTRRPNDSHIRISFNRDVDFGFTHERIDLDFNGTYYKANMLVKNDTVVLSSIIFDTDFEQLPYYDYFNKKHSTAKIDSARALNYLNLRNRFYGSVKTLRDLKDELDLDKLFALRNGDAYEKTLEKKHIDTLVLRKDINELENMLKSINCETQTYGVMGFYLLKKKGIRISANDEKIIRHIRKRNSDLESCAGDLCPVILKAYKTE